MLTTFYAAGSTSRQHSQSRCHIPTTFTQPATPLDDIHSTCNISERNHIHFSEKDLGSLGLNLYASFRGTHIKSFIDYYPVQFHGDAVPLQNRFHRVPLANRMFYIVGAPKPQRILPHRIPVKPVNASPIN